MATEPLFVVMRLFHLNGNLWGFYLAGPNINKIANLGIHVRQRRLGKDIEEQDFDFVLPFQQKRLCRFIISFPSPSGIREEPADLKCSGAIRWNCEKRNIARLKIMKVPFTQNELGSVRFGYFQENL